MKKVKENIVSLPDLLAPLQLDRYLVNDLVFKCNAHLAKEGQKREPPAISIDFEIKQNANDKNRFLLGMKVDLNQGQVDFEKYQIHLHLYGWFSFTAELDEETKTKMLSANASSMLYGVARSVVGDLTGSFGSERYILPTLNLLSVLKAKAAEANREKKVIIPTAKP